MRSASLTQRSGAARRRSASRVISPSPTSLASSSSTAGSQRSCSRSRMPVHAPITVLVCWPAKIVEISSPTISSSLSARPSA